MIDQRLMKLIAKLAKDYPLPIRTFGLTEDDIGSENWKFRRLITNVIVGGSNEDNALKATEIIFQQYPDCKAIYNCDQKVFRREIADMLEENDIKYPGKKTERILSLVSDLELEHNGEVPKFFNELTDLPGVGRHTASIIMSLAHGECDYFGVDLHVRRILKRMGFFDDKISDLALEKTVNDIVPYQTDLGRFSRNLVDFGRDVCSFNPDCSRCQVKNLIDCPTGSKVKSEPQPTIPQGEYKVLGSSGHEFTVTVSCSKITCRCKGFKYRRKCSHVDKVRKGEINATT